MGAPAIKEAEPWDRTSVTMPTRVWDKIEKMLSMVNADRPKPERYSRDRFMAELLDWACEELRKERVAASKKGGG